MRFAATALLLTFALGCGSEPSDPKKADPKGLIGKPGVPDAPATPTPPADPKAAAQKFVADFLAAVKAKTATADQLTADFKKVVALPLSAEDAAKGYSDIGAVTYLEKWAGAADEPKVELAGDVAFAAGRPGPTGRLLMRLAKDGGAWKVDWLSNGPATATEVAFTGGEDTAGVLFAAVAFTDAALRKDHALVAGLMTAKGREAVAFPFAAADKARGYNIGLLLAALDKHFGKADRAAVAGTTRTGPEATAKFDLTAGMTKSELTVKLAKGTKQGVWLVESFETK